MTRTLFILFQCICKLAFTFAILLKLFRGFEISEKIFSFFRKHKSITWAYVILMVLGFIFFSISLFGK